MYRCEFWNPSGDCGKALCPQYKTKENCEVEEIEPDETGYYLVHETETFELVGKDARDYFENDAEFGEMGYPLHEGDRVIVELCHDKQAATWTVVPEGENPSNFVPEEDDYDGVILWLVEHDFDSEGLRAARKAQVGL